MAEATAKSKRSASTKSKQQKPILVGIDVGFGELKYISNVKPVAQHIPSAVDHGQVSTSRLFDLSGIDLNNLIVTTPDGTYFVGDYALSMPSGNKKRTRTRDRARDEISRVLFHTGIALSVPDEDGEYDVHVITGLPNEDYDKTIHQNLKEFLSQPFEVEFHLGASKSIKKKINVQSVEILRQPEGTVTYHQFSFDPEQFLVASENAKNSIGVIDFGHYTTDFALFRDGIIIENDVVNNSTIGVTEVYDRLREKLKHYFDQEYGLDFKAPERELDQIIRSGKAHFMRQEFDVQHLIDESIQEVIVTIAKAILEAWGDETNFLELILAAGGGSHIFAEALREEFKKNKKQDIEVIEAAQFTNVLGFYMYGAIAAADREGTDFAYENYVKPVFEEVV